MMGVIVVPPPPRLSDDAIQPFDAIASQLQDVFPDAPPFPDATAAAATSWTPVPPAPPPPSDPARPWEAVQALWSTPGLGAGAGAEAVRAWAGCMGWGGDSVRGDVPERLVAGLQQMYVAAPLVAAAAA